MGERGVGAHITPLGACEPQDSLTHLADILHMELNLLSLVNGLTLFIMKLIKKLDY